MPITFTVTIHADPEGGGYWTECPQLPGCFTQGETMQETQSNMYEAVNLFLESENKIPEYSLQFEVDRNA